MHLMCVPLLPQEAERRVAYACDVTYVTNSELGFDFLRDNLATVRAEPMIAIVMTAMRPSP